MNEITRRKNLYDMLLLITLYLLISTNFYEQYILSPIVLYIIKFTLHLSFLVGAFFFIRKSNLALAEFKKLLPSSLLFIPFLLVTGSNFIFALFNRDLVLRDVDTLYLLIDGLLLNALVVFSEELLFRGVVFMFFLKIKTPLKSVIYSALLFGAVHFVNISSLGTVVPVLIQVVYTFFLGLLLGMAYYFTRNLLVPFFLHFTFNFLNDHLFSTLFYYENNFLFYTINSIVILLALAYGVFVYVYLTKQKEKEDVSNVMVH